jgi:ribosomal protein S18 acetylase RimI-like enzyme
VRHIDPGRPLLGLDDATVRFLEAHRLRAIAIPGRSWRDLGDGVLLHSDSERDPFFNRLAAVRWPEAPSAFDARLRQILDLFATLERRPYIWATPGATTPADIVARLSASGFVDQGGGLDMLLVDGGAGLEGAGPSVLPSGARLEHWHATPPDRLVERAEALALVVTEAFGIPAERHRNLVAEIALTLAQPRFHACLLTVDGEPVATGQRYMFDGASYLSSIGTRPSWRGRGLGTAITRRLAEESIADGVDLVYLAVEADNRPAVRLYEKLGFAALGPRSADMLAQLSATRRAR